MANYTYSDYDDRTLYPLASTRLDRCGKFIAELRERIDARTAGEGSSVDPQPILDLLREAKADYDRLLTESQSASGGNIVRIRRNRAR